MTQPVRSLRLTGRNSQSLDNITGSSGEIYYDRTLNCLRLYSGATNSAGGEKIADRDWVISQNYLTSVSWSQVADKPTLFSGDYDDLNDIPTEYLGLSQLGLSLGVVIDEFSNDPVFVDNSSTAVPTESAVRAYLDRRLGRDAEGTVVAVEAKIGPEYAVTDSPQFTGTVSVNNLEISGLVSPSYETVIPTGSDEATAAAITKNTVVIPTGSNTGGVRLPAGALGTRILIRNNSSSTHYVYAPPDQVIAGGFGGPDAITMAVLKEYLYLETGVWTVVTH